MAATREYLMPRESRLCRKVQRFGPEDLRRLRWSLWPPRRAPKAGPSRRALFAPGLTLRRAPCMVPALPGKRRWLEPAARGAAGPTP
jgi:hypothetical protein